VVISIEKYKQKLKVTFARLTLIMTTWMSQTSQKTNWLWFLQTFVLFVKSGCPGISYPITQTWCNIYGLFDGGFGDLDINKNCCYMWYDFVCTLTPKTNFQATLQQWQAKWLFKYQKHIFMFDDLPLNQKQKWFSIWIQHIKTIGKHSIPVIHILSNIRN